MDSKNLKPDTTSWDRGGWDGIIPNVRLIEIVLSDEFRVDFLHRNDAESRQQLDARGTEASNLSFWEKVQRKFNDRTFETTSCPLDANWGRQTFLEIHDCNWKELDALGIQPIPDENTCKKHYTNLNNNLGTIYKCWKASGNGDDQVAGSLEETEYGQINLELLPTQGGNRIDFLGNYNICVMYLWYALIKAAAFLHSQTEFPEGLQADGKAPEIHFGSGSSTGSMSSKSRSVHDKKMPARNDITEMEDFSNKIDRLNDTIILNTRVDRLDEYRREIQTDLKELYKEKNSLIEKWSRAKLDVQREQNAPEKAILQEMVDFYKEQLAELDKNY
jgi:uncharacterized protein (UPF0335 family)